jgi:FKBP-type peptidyl-prolyl cis-trans isomerase SlyD
MSLQIAKNTVATVHYRGTLTESKFEFDSSIGEEPLSFLVGHQQMIPGFENGLLGKVVGDKFTLSLSAEESYGEHDPRGIQEVPLDELPEDIKIDDELVAETPEGHMIPIRVVNISEDQIVTIDMNHELAGQALTFEIEVLKVREASDEEKSHGHVHGVGGHQH